MLQDNNASAVAQAKAPRRQRTIRSRKVRNLSLWGFLIALFFIVSSGFPLENSMSAYQEPDSGIASADTPESMSSSSLDGREEQSGKNESTFKSLRYPMPPKPAPLSESERYRSRSAHDLARWKRAELLSLGSQLTGMGLLQAADAWHTGHRPFANAGKKLRRAWTTAPEKDDDSYFYNYIGHPYTGAFTYNLMRSQNASPLTSWLFSCSQSLIWEFTFEATEQQPSIQDLLLTSNLGSLIGEASHRLTARFKKNGLSTKEKILILLINPSHVLNNGFH